LNLLAVLRYVLYIINDLMVAGKLLAMIVGKKIGWRLKLGMDSAEQAEAAADEYGTEHFRVLSAI
jgi:hypothetical protein